MILTLIFLAFAAACNAVMDTSVQHYTSSIFAKFNPLWWDGSTSWKNKYVDGDPTKGYVKWYFGFNKPVQLTDAFHFFKMWMIIFICLSIVNYSVHFVTIVCQCSWYAYPLMVLILGTTWNLTFSLFYNKILKK